MDPSDPRVIGWLDDLEQAHNFVVLETDPSPSPWSERCIRHPDRLLLVGRPESACELGPLEQLAAGYPEGKQDLVLLQSSADRLPSRTARWLDARNGRLERHHHVHLGHPPRSSGSLDSWPGRRWGWRWVAEGPWVRTHRGNPSPPRAGSAHRCYRGHEYGVDRRSPMRPRLNRCRDASSKSRGVHRPQPALRLHPPDGCHAEWAWHVTHAPGLFDDVRIEDLWVAYMAVSSNMTRGAVMVHSRGLLRRYVRASASVPGILPPLAEGGELLVDGGVLNTCPRMRARACWVRLGHRGQCQPARGVACVRRLRRRPTRLGSRLATRQPRRPSTRDPEHT